MNTENYTQADSVSNNMILYISILVCTAGYYGENCSSRCGYCLDNLACHPVTGNCIKGCKPGYQKQMCTEGILSHL